MRNISLALPLPKDGDDTRPSRSNRSVYIIRCAIDWLSSGSVPPISVEINIRGISVGFCNFPAFAVRAVKATVSVRHHVIDLPQSYLLTIKGIVYPNLFSDTYSPLIYSVFQGEILFNIRLKLFSNLSKDGILSLSCFGTNART